MRWLHQWQMLPEKHSPSNQPKGQIGRFLRKVGELHHFCAKIICSLNLFASIFCCLVFPPHLRRRIERHASGTLCQTQGARRGVAHGGGGCSHHGAGRFHGDWSDYYGGMDGEFGMGPLSLEKSERSERAMAKWQG